MAAPVVFHMGHGVVDGPVAIFKADRAEHLGPALLGGGIELVGPAFDWRRLSKPAADAPRRPRYIAEVVAPFSDGDRVARPVGDLRDPCAAIAVEATQVCPDRALIG